MIVVPHLAAREARHLAGTVQLNGQKLPVEITYNTFSSQESIRIGDDTFQLNSYGAAGFQGHRLVKENDKTLADENVMVAMDGVQHIAADPKAAAQGLGLDNVAEFNFAPGDNAFIIRSDNIKMTNVGNCFTLK